MTGVAYNGSSVSQTTKSGHVTYDIERWVERFCSNRDEETGACLSWGGGVWVSAGSGSTNAVVSPSGVVSASNVYVNGRAIACLNDLVPDTWEANPAVPTSNGSTRYVNISPSRSGSGQGRVTSGSSTVFAGGRALGSINSAALSSLGTSARITTGSSNVFTN
ncbi:hypothetical protein SAMN05720606_10885 [Paenibacillus polysaccharolyticus]|uniref:Uncharacterized protein n=1 Tax=Paenibacillus polysaccharolyticus TaxID=582692 RepID=A0A1G5I8G8_9BACL|nr:hypothetical protein [Paenibacillus polysaccharolyticus]MDP9698877.1 hypothetical protein [Paenibacillus intestini]SCY71970.1 hypothetical protein SAMN05720606_10885 [Paenibacillus polysaccharolyticus]